MKKILITCGALIILLIIGAWLYVLVVGTPKSVEDIFAKFGNGGDSIPVTPRDPDPRELDPTPVPVKLPALRQLTTRPVAGAVATEKGVRYSERGTGHLYEINITDGKETLIGGTTIPQTVIVQFSSDGNTMAFTTEKNEVREIIVGKLTKGDGGMLGIDGVTLPLGAREIGLGTTATTSGHIQYLLNTETGSSGYIYDLATKKSTSVFSIPLRDVRVLWGSPLYVYTSPTAQEDGYAYEVKGNKLLYITASAPSLMAIPYATGLMVTKHTKTGLITEDLGAPKYQAAGVFFNEKCVSIPKQIASLYCATPTNELSEGEYPDDWYKGKASFSDILWNVNIGSTTATVLSNFLAESGREIDVASIYVSADGNYIYFINKNDGALWLFDTTISN